MRRRRTSIAMIAAGVLCGATSIAGVSSSSAQEAPPAAATLFSYDLQAGARGYSMYYEDPSGARQGEGTVPESSSSLTTGPIGLGRASMAWPGPVAANSGSLIGVLAPDAPDQAKEANYPVRAEARTGQEPPTTTNEIPGAKMTATATAELVESAGQVESFAGGGDGTFGPSRAESRVTLKGATGTSESESVVEKVSLAGGVVKIDSVTSTAKAVTDGTTSDASGSTVVSGMTVGGQPATIDEDGLSFGDEGQPANAVTNQIAKEALSGAGVEMVLGAPTREVDGPTAVASAPSLVITWEQEGGTFGVVLGGARAMATGAPPLDDALLGGDTGTTDAAAPAAPAPTTDAADTGGTPGGDAGLDDGAGAIDAGPAPTGDPGLAPPGSDGGGEVALDDVEQVRAASKPVKAGYLLLGLLASILVAWGMRRLGDEVLAERVAGAACPLDGRPS